jgi:hypothetical protein
MCDDIYYYKGRASELEAINNFLKKNTLQSVQSKLEWIKENGGGIDHAIEAIKSMLKD